MVWMSMFETLGMTPHCYLRHWKGHGDVVQCLLEHGAHVDLRDQYDNTPLTLAASGGHVDAVRLLLEHNADVNSQDNRAGHLCTT
jgi:ankyrin repeat protein